ncbi:MAG: IS4 family transposase [Leptolyngbyaceae cyanobacterium CRU_2_3]|nr:IS4 family transposase [Acaryochloris sp. RU_4_1]NJR64098.1 IS4 family transposase [Leptolyngbyaceae cyanobacterium CRU_2_3]
MNQVTLLRETLRPHLGWHGARLNFLATFLIALVRVKTVNFSELASGFSGSAHPDSHFKRLQRFFRHYAFDVAELVQAGMTLMRIPEPWVLSIDRTEWQFGDCIFNILMLGVVHQGVAFPLVWCLLDKRGNSNTHERIDLFNQFLARFEGHQIACLTADREFLGQGWFEYLLTEPLTPFRIRIRQNHTLSDGHQRLSVRTLFQDLQVGQHKVLRHQRSLWGQWVYIAALRLDDGELLVVATQSAPKSAIADYAKRWGIETLFGIFKTRGFCLESTHLTDPERLSKLLALLSLALCWVFLTGEWLHRLKPLTLKKHGRRAKSLFRYGFDYLRNIVLNLERKMDEFLNVLQFLSCT